MVKPQRTKGNTKPSSSRRTAELLASSGAEAVNSFVGFSSLSAIGAEDEDIDSDFKVVFKKMAKKDCITKIKALQEFQQLINEKTDINVKTMLVQWSRIYSKLAIDIDWRVRETTHKTQEQLFIKVGKHIAPHLKQLMPIWFTSQYDPYTPAATAAVNSFETAFPPPKRSGALVFSQNYILNYIKDVLLNQTIESVSEDTATPEENKTKYNRLVSNSLQGLSALISSLPTSSLDEVQPIIQELVDSNKFWKWAKFTDSLIRKSWYTVMATIAQCFPHLFKLNATKICGLTLGKLDEKDFLVAGAVWDCALITIITIDDCWKFVDFRKAFYPQLRGILREGGRGNAAKIFPNLLPLLNQIPLESTEKYIEFHKEFYSFLREGLEKTSKSQSETNAIIKAFMECLRFSIHSTPKDKEEDQSFQLYLIQNQLLSLVSDAISNDCLSKSSIFSDLGVFWMYLKKDNKHMDLIQQISSKLTEICLNKINERELKSFPRISRLIFNLFSDSKEENKEKTIRFRRESDADGYKLRKNIKLNDLIGDQMAVSFLNKITFRLIDGFNTELNDFQTLNLLIEILRTHIKSTFDQLLSLFNIQSFDIFWSNFIEKWFKKCSLLEESEEKSKIIKSLVGLTLNLLTFIEEKERKQHFLDQIQCLNDPYVCEPLFSAIISSDDKCLTEWLKSEKTGTSLVLMISKLIDDIIKSSNSSSKPDSDILWKLISHCFADNSFDKHSVEKVIQNLSKAMQNNCLSTTNDTQFMVEFTCRLATQLFSCYELCTSLVSARELLLTIFSINCRFDKQNDELLNAWKTGVVNIVKSNGCYLSEDGIITKLILQIKSRLQSNITSIKNAQLIFSCGFELINTIYETINGSDSEDNNRSDSLFSDTNILLVFDLMFLTNTEWNELKNKCDYSVIHYNWLNRDTLFDANNCKMINNFDTNGVPFVFSAICTALLIEKLLKDNLTEDLSPELCQVLINQSKYVSIATSYAAVKSKTNSNFLPILSLLEKSFTNIIDIFVTIDKNLVTKLRQLLFDASIDENGITSQSLGYFLNKFNDYCDQTEFNLSFDALNYNQIITFQKYCPKLSQNRLNEIFIQSFNSFVCCESFIQLEDGIAKLAVLYSSLKYIDSNSEEVLETVISIIENLIGLKNSNSGLFYTTNDIEANSDLQFYCLICQIFDLIVTKFSNNLNQNHWDFIFLTTTSWIQNIHRQRERLTNHLSINLFATKVFKLIATVAQTMKDMIENETKDSVKQLFIEWNEFHSNNLFQLLFDFYFHFCEMKSFNFYDQILVNYLTKAVVFVPIHLIPDFISDRKHDNTFEVNEIDIKYHFLYLSEEKENLLNTFCPLLRNSYLPFALSSHQLILGFIPFLLDGVTQPNSTDEDIEEEINLSVPKPLLSVLKFTDHIVDSLLNEFSIGQCCVVDPQTDSFTYTFGYLLVWVEILEVITKTCDENPILRPQFTSFLEKTKLLPHLLTNLFRLMPLSSTDTNILSADLFDKHLTEHCFVNYNEPLDPSAIQRLSCHLYYQILRQMPASVRQWWRNCDRKAKDIINEITSNYFSSVLTRQELEAVQRVDAKDFKNMTISPRLKAREVVAKYVFEEMVFELLLTLPKSYPLEEVSIIPITRMDVNVKQSNKWQLQLHQFLNYQNGLLIDGIKIFQKSLNQKFDGVEECMICFFVIHSGTLQKPEKKCKHCRKHYHSECLYKWFRTSNNNLCPMCRQLWRF